jgi:hemolysin III
MTQLVKLDHLCDCAMRRQSALTVCGDAISVYSAAMTIRRPLRRRSKDGSPHVTDERFNTASHLVASIFALLGTVVLVGAASVTAKPWHIVSFSVYGSSLFSLFLASTLHHGIEGSRVLEERLRSFDYYAIFLLIAGTFTPICLVVVGGLMGWAVFGVVWAVAIVGVAIKAIRPNTPKWLFLTLFGAMGWMALVLVPAAARALPFAALVWLLVGGILYSGGAAIFIRERPNPMPGVFGFHEIWHVAVIGGALAHFFLMFQYVLPL